MTCLMKEVVEEEMLGPIAVFRRDLRGAVGVGIRVGEVGAVAAVLCFDEGDVWVGEECFARGGEHADEGVVGGVENECWNTECGCVL